MTGFTFSGTTVLLGLGGLCLLLALGVHVLRRRLHHARPSASDSRTKLAAADLFRYTPAIHRVSLCAALFASLLTINWTQWRAGPPTYTGVIEADETIEMLPPRTFDPPQPPPTPPPPPAIVEPVPDEQAETVELIDQGISADDAVVVEVPPVFAKPAVVAPPLSSPAPREENIPDIFVIVEHMPVFGEDCLELSGDERKSCSDRALLGFLTKHLKYPRLAAENDIEGTVCLKFVVETDGSVSNIEVMRGVAGGLTEAALKAVAQINARGQKFSPGIQAGRPVRVAFNLPIHFKLN
ncbi:energy transducer TonB [Neolewinella sp.]|uniref:energy transducer TonB n=1 Tax=Neolewinella sp. TaxID=2993543 RepID=UPI003B53014B